jgi:hypothetical protein
MDHDVCLWVVEPVLSRSEARPPSGGNTGLSRIGTDVRGAVIRACGAPVGNQTDRPGPVAAPPPFSLNQVTFAQ